MCVTTQIEKVPCSSVILRSRWPFFEEKHGFPDPSLPVLHAEVNGLLDRFLGSSHTSRGRCFRSRGSI